MKQGKKISESHRAVVADMESFIKERDERIQQKFMEEIKQQNERLQQIETSFLQGRVKLQENEKKLQENEKKLQQLEEEFHRSPEEWSKRMDEMKAEFWAELEKKMTVTMK